MRLVLYWHRAIRAGQEIQMAFLGCLLAMVNVTHAQSYSLLHSFSGGAFDGAYPFGSLIQSGSCLYGMTAFGGSSNGGVIFSLNTTDNAMSLLHTFTGSDGWYPYGSLIESGSTLYGATGNGGTNIDGNIFSFNTNNNTISQLYSFAGKPDGIGPEGSLVQSGNILYGMTQAGGNSGHGTIFGFDTSTKTESLVYSFGGEPNDGSAPYSSLIQSGPMLYGMTSAGGTSNSGAIVGFNTTSNTENVLYSFGSQLNDGNVPYGSLIASGNTLYGATAGGGKYGFGTLFSLDLTNDRETILRSFNGSDGNGADSLILSGSILYGVTVSSSPQGGTNGNIYSFDVNTDAYGILHTFRGIDGGNDFGNLLLVGSTLYGMSEYGGLNNKGVVFALTVPEPSCASVAMLIATTLLARRRRPGGGSTMNRPHPRLHPHR